MKIKASYWIMALLLAAACTHGEGDEAQPQNLVFTAVASHTSKSIITTTTYPQDRPFRVDALYSRGDAYASEVSSYFFHDEVVRYEADVNCWRTVEDYLWPENGILEFFAFSPCSLEATIDNKGGVVADFAINNLEDAQIDFCHAHSFESCSQHPASVPIVFNHALTQLCFKVKMVRNHSSHVEVDDLVQDNEVTIALDSMRIRNVLTEGHFTQIPLQWTVDEESVKDFWLHKGPSVLLGYDSLGLPAASELATVLAIPQEINDNMILDEWHTVHVKSTLYDKSTEETSVTEYDVKRSSSLYVRDVCRSWDIENKYTFRYVVGVNPGDENMSVAVTDWTETKEKFVEE